MVVGITEVCRIGEHDGGEPLLPERGVVAPSGVRELLSVARHDQWNNREVRLHGLRDGAGQAVRPLVADHGKKISGRGHGDGHTGRNFLRVR